jgi:hypothetical protein
LVRKRDDAPKAPLNDQCQSQSKLRWRFFQAVGRAHVFSARRTKMAAAGDLMPNRTAFTPE